METCSVNVNPLHTYYNWIDGQDLTERNRRIYRRRVCAFVEFVQATSGLDALAQCDQLVASAEQYRDHLLALEGMRPSSVNSQLTAIAHFCRCLHGMPAHIRRVEEVDVQIKLLSDAQKARFEKAIAMCSSVRDQVLAHLILSSGVRLRECVALNVADFFPEERLLIASASAADTDMRVVSLSAQTCELLVSWLAERTHLVVSAEEALFLSRRGSRLSGKSVDFALRRIGISCGLEVCARTLRNTFLCQLAQDMPDPEHFASAAGYSQQTFAARYYAL